MISFPTIYYPRILPSVVSFKSKELAPGEGAVLKLEMELPFMLKGFVADRENGKGVFVDDVLIGDRSLLEFGNVLHVSSFHEANLPMTFRYPFVPVGQVLKVLAHNSTDLPRTLRMAAVGECLMYES